MTANPSHALEWYLKAARAGDTRAKHNAGIMLVLGLGVERDVARGIAWLDESFAAGSVESALALGELSRQGVGQPEDLDRAVLFYRFAAEAGDVRAWHALGNLALRGKGPRPGQVSAFSWYRCAAQKGHLPSVAAMDAMKRKLGWHETLRAISTVCHQFVALFLSKVGYSTSRFPSGSADARCTMANSLLRAGKLVGVIMVG